MVGRFDLDLAVIFALAGRCADQFLGCRVTGLFERDERKFCASVNNKNGGSGSFSERRRQKSHLVLHHRQGEPNVGRRKAYHR